MSGAGGVAPLQGASVRHRHRNPRPLAWAMECHPVGVREAAPCGVREAAHPEGVLFLSQG